MSKLRADNINFDDEHDFLVAIKNVNDDSNDIPIEVGLEDTRRQEEELLEQKREEIILEAQLKAKSILDNAQLNSEQIVSEANKKAESILENANNEASKIKDDAQNEAQNLINNANEEVEALRIEKAKEGYNEGHTDGLIKIQEELEEKINNLDEFCKVQLEMKEKILLSLSNEILSIINNISKKVLLKELDGKTLEKIIKQTVSKLEKKENITVTLSEKYAKLLYEVQKQQLENENLAMNFEDFKQYSNFEIVYNPKYSVDTIIVENLKERFDASVSSQLDIILNNIYDSVENTQKGRIEIESKSDET